MNLSREQFDVLDIIATSADALTESELISGSGYDSQTAGRIIRELTDLGYINRYSITDGGLNALEPYRVKHAVFFAAGFGKRLVPITLNTPKPLVRVNGIRIIDRLIDACLAAGIEDIYIVRGYLAEQFDSLLYKYPMIRFIDNPLYNAANNISSSLLAGDLLSNSYVFEADLLIYNPAIIKKYNYSSNFLAIKKESTDDWCFRVEEGIIIEEKVGGEGKDIWQMVGISYWDDEDGKKLRQDIEAVYNGPDGTERYWEQVPLVYKKENYKVEVRACKEEDITEIDTFDELKAIDKAYDV